MSFLISKHVENRITYVTLFKSIIRVQNFFCRVDISNLLIKLEEILSPKVQIIQSHAVMPVWTLMLLYFLFLYNRKYWIKVISYCYLKGFNEDSFKQLYYFLHNLNPLTAKSDPDGISPYKIETISMSQVTRLKTDISYGILCWSNTKFPELSS